MSPNIPLTGFRFSESDIICNLSVIICFEAEEIRICFVHDLSASIIRDGDRAVKINLDVADVDSIILLRYGCLIGPR